jgi:transcriptional regulator with XRE-family HTH domain
MANKKFSELPEAMPSARRERIAERVSSTVAAMSLDELRRARQMTQVSLAESLGVNQGEVSKIEHRTDVYLSTLSEYVEALGGTLEIRAIFPDREVRITQFDTTLQA